MSAWIRMLADAEAGPELAAAFERVRTPAGTVDNVMRVHSLRPSTMTGHHALYMSALHDEANVLPGWFLETVASYVSILNRCRYSLTNHWTNARHLMTDEGGGGHSQRPRCGCSRARLRRQGARDAALCAQAHALARDMVEADVQAMRYEGAEDGEILEVNQVCGYFNYVNRLLNGLGVTLKGDVIGYYAHTPVTRAPEICCPKRGSIGARSLG